VLLGGEKWHAKNPLDAIKKGVVLVTEDRKRFGIFDEHSVGFNLSLSSLSKFKRFGLLDHNKEIRVNGELFDSLKIKAPSCELIVSELSGGNQQKVVLGKSIMTNPRVILLDEPTRGIDVGAKVEIYDLINSFKRQGKAVILVSSELQELLGISDRIVVLSQGRIGGVFQYGEADQEALLRAAMVLQNGAIRERDLNLVGGQPS
jgi:D-xylose transport system ATP-binding protein